MEKKAQVWVETVIYTLIAFVLIGTVLAFVRPKIEEFQDKAILEQTIVALEDINTIILSIVQGGPGNRRLIELGIQEGTLRIDSENDKIFFEMESRYTYSEPGATIEIGNTKIETKTQGDISLVTITLDYSSKHNITYQDQEILKIINKATTPYRLSFSNNGKQNTKTQIDIEIL
ncbi:MAG: hypothetical protein OQK82_07445 [Candidatus Pacearchaeota archaeon]|nr:hypothetical protein [Candidatus Pacearchaeota archaeon]